MTPRDTGRTIQVVVRLDYDLIARLDAITEKLSRPGLTPTRTDVVRTVLIAGLPVVEEREGIAKRRK